MNAISPKRGQYMVKAKAGFWRRFAARAFRPLLDRFDAGLCDGAIEMMLPDGTVRILGGRGKGPYARVTINRWRSVLRLVRSGSVGGYQSWEKGEWESPDIVTFFSILMLNRVALGDTARASGFSRIAKRLSFARKRNDRAGAQRNVHAHYDLGNDFYRAWLDPTMTYSCALFAEPMNGEERLEVAQKRKMQTIGKRLKLKPGASILEIGCGWGYFSRLCADKSHHVTAITLSPAQKIYAEGAAAHLKSPPDYRLMDYRDITGQFDAIVSIEMVEAVGQSYWPDFLDRIVENLKPGGRAAIQYITIDDAIFESYAKNADFIQTYIFPGGLLLSETRFRKLAEDRGLLWENSVRFGPHYAETLRRWRTRFDDVVENGKLPTGFDARFVNLWRYYLMYCEAGFRGGGINVVQVTLVKK